MSFRSKNLSQPAVRFTAVSVLVFGLLVGGFQATLSSLFTWELSFFKGYNSSNNQSSLFIDPLLRVSGSASELSFIQGNSLANISTPHIITSRSLGAVGLDGSGFEQADKEIIEYTVKAGDTFSRLAEEFGISQNTILWANKLSKGSTLKEGQTLIILPINGVIYHVQSGDTLRQIAKKYKGEVDEMVSFNELASADDIYLGDILIIPNGIPPANTTTNPIPQIPIGSSYFIAPTTLGRVTQGLHWYNAVDVGGKCGDPIYSAAAGTVISMKYGWNGGGGNTLKIQHPNGVITYYGHLAAGLVSPGQQVSQGQVVAAMGGQPGQPGAGISTGCHVHFGVIGGANPFAR